MKIFTVLLALAAVFVAQQSLSAPTDDSVTRFVTAFNSGSHSDIAAYVQAHVLPAAPDGADSDTTASLLQLRDKIGTISVASVRDLPRRTVATVHSERDGWYVLQFVKPPSPDAAHRFARLTWDLGLPPPGAGQDVNRYVTSLSPDDFSGVVLTAKPNGTPSVLAAGWANREKRIPDSANTLFNIGSLGKLFTTTAIYQLIEKGVVRKTDTIGKWLPDYPNAEARQATIDELLSMRSGIGDFFNPRFFDGDPGRVRTLSDYLPFFASDPLAFKPGTGQLYSNGGFIVLGLIVEKASHTDFYSYVQKHIFNPAQMSTTAYLTRDQVVPNRAIGYTRQWDDVPTHQTALRPTGAREPGRGSSAGGAYSTVGDLYKFWKALGNGTLLHNHYEWSGPGNFYAGGTPGWNAALDVEESGTTIVLANLDPPTAETLAQNLRP